MNPRSAIQTFAPSLLAFAVAQTFAAAPAPDALPTGGRVTAGAASIAQAGARMDVTQASQRAILEWQRFDVGSQAKVNFTQPNASSVALNRVLAGEASQIHGRLSANGQVFLVNPAGIVFGAGSRVGVGGLVASTLDVKDEDFLAGRNVFAGSGGAVVNRGTLTAADGGYVALLAPEARNEGVITARLGTVALGAGNKVALDLQGDGLLALAVDKGAVDALAENRHLIQADGGRVLMSARAANEIAGAVVSNEGTIRARTLQNHGGVIKLLGDMAHGTVKAGGTLDASAPNGGDGGFVETSAAKVSIAPDARVTTAAAPGGGKTGTWLIDPNDYTIAAAGGDITGAQLGTNLDGNNVTILSSQGGTAGNGDVFVNDAVSWTSANTLTLSAVRNVEVNQNLASTGGGSVVLRADSGGTGTGAVSFGGGSISLTGGAGGKTVDIYYNPSDYTTPTDFSGNVAAGTLTSWMLVNDVDQLQAMNTNLSGSYALGKDIDASATAGWNAGAGFVPVGDWTTRFTGKFDGMSHAIDQLAINRPTDGYVGLFGYTDGTIVRNVALSQLSITGKVYVGGLIGVNNDGTVSDSYSAGTISKSTNSSGSVGGLVGSNGYYGTISNCYSTGTVSSTAVGGTVNDFAGGLLGYNAGTVSKSFSTGIVSGSNSTGGLTGGNGGNVTTSYWNTTTSGQATSAGGTGLTTAHMMTGANFTSATAANGNVNPNWDFTNTWRIYDGHTYPMLKAFLVPLSITAGNVTKTYDANPYAGNNGVVYAGFTGGDNSTNLSGALTYGGASQGAINAGSYAITPQDYWSTKYDITFTNGTLTVNSVALAITAPAAANKTYDGTIAATVTPGALSGFVGAETVTATAAGTFANVNAGDGKNVTVAYTLHNGTNSGLAGNYSLANGATTADIAKASLTVTANSTNRTYDGSAYAGGAGVAYSGFVNGETFAVLGGALAYGGSSQGAVDAGSYSIVPSGLTSGNYTLTFANGTLTIDQLIIALGVGADDKSKTYGSADPALTWHVSSGSLQGGDGFSGSLARDAGENAGGYAIHQGTLTAGGNYAISFANGTLTIAKAPLTVTANAATKTYDGNAYSGGNGVSYSGFVSGDTAAALGGTLAYGGSAQGAVNAGSYAIAPSGLVSGNYAIGYVDGMLTVNKAPLTVAANNAAKTYDGLAYAGGDGAAYSGFVHGETASVLGGTPVYGGSAKGAVDAGSYAITLGGLSAANYDIAYVDGTLTVNRAPLSVTANAAGKTYDGLAYSGGNGASYSGFVNDETAAALGGALAYGGTSQGAVNAGSYRITPSGLTSGNYAIAYVDGTLSVAKAPLIATANDASKFIDGTAYTGGSGVTYTGFVNGENEAALGGSLVYGGTSQGASGVGSYSIAPSGLASGNYSVGYVDGTLTIAFPPASGPIGNSVGAVGRVVQADAEPARAHRPMQLPQPQAPGAMAMVALPFVAVSENFIALPEEK